MNKTTQSTYAPNERTAVRYSSVALLLTLLLLLSGCAEEERSDAYGQFEAEPVTVSAEVGGSLLAFEPLEGEQLQGGRQVGVVDTTQLSLQVEELQARQEALRAEIANVEAETDVAREELDRAQRDLRRIRALTSDGAATQKQLDDAEGMVRTMEKRIHALETQKASVRAGLGPLAVQVRQVRDRIGKARIINPLTGRVLTTLVKRHELVGGGQPLYEIAALDTLILRVYVSGGQLPQVTLGEQVEVLVDESGPGLRRLSGTVSWVAAESEFTPRMIQTREERVSQVYAVKVRVPNPDGRLKIGMPGEVNFGNGEDRE